MSDHEVGGLHDISIEPQYNVSLTFSHMCYLFPSRKIASVSLICIGQGRSLRIYHSLPSPCPFFTKKTWMGRVREEENTKSKVQQQLFVIRELVTFLLFIFPSASMCHQACFPRAIAEDQWQITVWGSPGLSGVASNH